MVSEHKLYKMREKAKGDKDQTRLGMDGKLKPTHNQMVTITTTVNFNMMVSCPFCLHDDKLKAFLVSTKKGISQKKANCPECHNGMMMKSLTADWTPEEYAEWVFEYRRSGFWQKCKFSTWKDRLYKRGWSKRFWDKYRELKGSDESEDYFDHLDSQQEEARRQWEEDRAAGLI